MSENNYNPYDVFATQATEKYDEFIAWMIQHWPQRSDPLSTADFSAGKREMNLLLGAKLHAAGDSGQPIADVAATNDRDNAEQYLPVTPAPWP